jgi:hypothetical protein
MVAKSRPRRRPVVQAGILTPDQWPDWVMSFPVPWVSPDVKRQAARMVRFHQWRRDRDAWLLKAGVTWMAVYTEHRRRTIAWQALHPEDRGPTFRTTPKG